MSEKKYDVYNSNNQKIGEVWGEKSTLERELDAERARCSLIIEACDISLDAMEGIGSNKDESPTWLVILAVLQGSWCLYLIIGELRRFLYHPLDSLIPLLIYGAVAALCIWYVIRAYKIKQYNKGLDAL